MSIKGVEQVKRGIRVAVDEAATSKTEGAIFTILFQGSEMSKLMTPIDTSNLVNSLYAPRITATPGGYTGAVGYTAAYARAVHEAPGKLKGLPRADFGKTRAGVAFGGGKKVGRYWDPNAEPGFLRKAFEQLRPAIPAILKEHYRVK